MTTDAIDFDALSSAQRRVLGDIAVGLDSGHNFRTLRELRERGLVVAYEKRIPGFPPTIIHRYEVPLPVHMAWCEWCAAQPDDEGD